MRVDPIREALVTDGRELENVAAIVHEPARRPMAVCPELVRGLHALDPRLEVVFNKAKARWQVVALHKGKLRLVKTWEDDDGGYLPLTMKVYEWCAKTDLSRVLKTDNPHTQALLLEAQEQADREREQRRISDDIGHFMRDNANVLRRWHARWLKGGQHERDLYINAGKKRLA